jgi:hypothetical protein
MHPFRNDNIVSCNAAAAAAAAGDRWSRLTFLVYLNDDFEGGATTYYTANEEQVGPACAVKVC